jgi:hypothetical protein
MPRTYHSDVTWTLPAVSIDPDELINQKVIGENNGNNVSVPSGR